PGPTRAEAFLLLATILWFDASPDAEGLACRALAEAEDDRRLQARIHARLAWMALEVERGRTHSRAAIELLDEGEDPTLYGFALLNWAQASFHSGKGPHAAEIERGRALQRSDTRWEYSTIPACWEKAMDRFESARLEFEEYVRRATDQGDESSL